MQEADLLPRCCPLDVWGAITANRANAEAEGGWKGEEDGNEHKGHRGCDGLPFRLEEEAYDGSHGRRYERKDEQARLEARVLSKQAAGRDLHRDGT